MKRNIFLAMTAAAALLACGKAEEAVVAPAAPEPPALAQPAPVAPSLAPEAAVEEAPAAIEAPAEEAVKSAPAAAAPPPKPAPVKPNPAPASVAPPPSAAEPAAVAPVPAPKPDLAHGQQIYRQSCAVCHDKGVAGAPKLGDSSAWAPRLTQGMDALYTTALRGKGAMPAKGGNPALADTDVKAAVDYLVAQAR